MFGTKFRGTVFATLAWAGFCWAEQPMPAPVEVPGSERVISLQEPGKEGQKCRVLVEVIQPDGMTELQLENIQTGEHTSILEPTPRMSLVPTPMDASPAPPVSPAPRQAPKKKGWGFFHKDEGQTKAPGATRPSSTEPPLKFGQDSGDGKPTIVQVGTTTPAVAGQPDGNQPQGTAAANAPSSPPAHKTSGGFFSHLFRSSSQQNADKKPAAAGQAPSTGGQEN